MFDFFSRTPSISPKELEGKLDEKPLIIDVRSTAEYRGGHIPGAKNVPLHKIDQYKPKSECYVVCTSGMRSKRAAKQLKANGFEAVNLKGGMGRWNGPTRGGKL